ncbi:MAG: maleate cis-trans isomerase [Nitrososphaeria archaeon]|nr:maleate cis-trans isomerase [Nitrososphaeria archaeon]NIQ33392.1 maleate cis-trans isomerase [Nitrososphaeria archaeon]
MYGWRARIGLIVPPTNTVIEAEFHRMIPAGVSVHTSRVEWRRPEVGVKGATELSEGVVDAARRVATADVNLIVWGCTGGSFVKGVGFDQEIIKNVEEATNIPAMTTSTSVVEALKALKLKRFVMATPYPDELNEREKTFFEGHGFEILKMKGLQIRDTLNIGRLHPVAAYELARELDSPEADGVFISCTDFRTIDIIGDLELDLGKPVISSNQSTMWYALWKVGVREPIEGFGSLLEATYSAAR